MTKPSNEHSHLRITATPLILDVKKKPAEMAQALTVLIEAATKLREEIKEVQPGTKFAFKVEISDARGVARIIHQSDPECKPFIIILECEGGNGGD